jgi:hypothetical protein
MNHGGTEDTEARSMIDANLRITAKTQRREEYKNKSNLLRAFAAIRSECAHRRARLRVLRASVVNPFCSRSNHPNPAVNAPAGQFLEEPALLGFVPAINQELESFGQKPF